MERPCPVCGKPATIDKTNRFRPFCSERCQLIDLSKWLDGAYAIPGEAAEIPEAPEES